MLEQELRQAMAEDTVGLHAAPDLHHQVVRRSRRRSRVRRRAMSAVAAVVLVATGLSGYFLTRPTEQVAVPPPAVVDSVEVRHLPPGLGTPRAERVTDDRLTGLALIWPSDAVRITVYRNTKIRTQEDFARLPGRPVLVRDRPGLISATGTDLLWLEQAGFLLRVTVDAAHANELRPIADGLYPQDPARGLFEGMRVGHLPDGLHLAGVSYDAEQGIRIKTWTGDGGAFTLAAYRDRAIRDEASLTRWAAIDRHLRLGRPTGVNGMIVHPSADGSSRVWMGVAGQAFVLTGTENLEPELDRVMSGIEPVEQPDRRDFEGLDVGFIPRHLESDGELRPLYDGKGLSWTDGGERWMRVEVVKGRRARTLDDLEEISWPDGERLTGVRATTTKHQRALAGRVVAGDGTPRGRMILWVVRPGYGVRVHVSDAVTADDLQGVLDGIVVRCGVSGPLRGAC